MKKHLHFAVVFLILLIPCALLAQTNNFHIVADTNAIRGNSNQAYSDCGTCNARFHVIANNYYDKAIAWSLISAPSGYANCGSSFFADNYNCIDGDCTFHMHGVCPGEYVIAAQDMDYYTATNTIVSDTITVIIRAVNNGSVATTANNLLCNGGLTGSISVQSTLPGPLTYLWNNNNTTSGISSLSAGTYTVTVTDANKCEIIESITVTEPSAILISPVFVNNQVPGPNTGSIDLTISGGIPPYNFLWSTGATTQQISQLAAGTYMVTVTDANNCIENRIYRLIADSIQSTGIGHAEDFSFELYPNPFSETIKLSLKNHTVKDYTIEVLNVLGKQVFIKEYKNSDLPNTAINLKQLPNGIYFLKLTGYRLNKTVRLIKQ